MNARELLESLPDRFDCASAVPVLLAALQAVLRRHQLTNLSPFGPQCGSCADAYPCDTVRDIIAELKSPGGCCPTCDGAGAVKREGPCSDCYGTGHAHRFEEGVACP